MKKDEKKELIEKLRSKILKANGIFLSDYKGINFVDLTELRKKLRAKSGELHIAKNTLMKLALKDTPSEGLSQFLEGQNCFVFSYGDGIEIAKVLNEGSQKFPNLRLKAGIFEGQIYDSSGVQNLAKLPSKTELKAKLVRTIGGPISGFVRVLSGPIRSLVIVLNEINKKKQAA